MIADVTDNVGNIMDLDTIKNVFGIENMNPLHYLRVQQNIKMFLRKYGFTQMDRIETFCSKICKNALQK